MHTERSCDWRRKFGVLTRNESGRDVFDLKCVGIAGVQHHAVEGMNADKFDVAVRVEYALVSAQEADDLRAGIGRNKRPFVVEGDGVRKIDRAPIQAKGVFLRAKRDGLGATGA